MSAENPPESPNTDGQDIEVQLHPAFREWMAMCLSNVELKREYDRLRGTTISTEVKEPEATEFFQFCCECYLRIDKKALK